jgi:type II secretory pathway predicted ATPase ExeA
MFLDFYHLYEQPFGVTPDTTYLYPSRTHCEALDALTEGILGDRGFLALIAEPGRERGQRRATVANCWRPISTFTFLR